MNCPLKLEMLIRTLSAASADPGKERNVSKISNILVIGRLTVAPYICRCPKMDSLKG